MTQADIGKLFIWMSGTFGHLWRKGETPTEQTSIALVWYHALKSFTTRDLRTGCELVMKSGAEHPPTAAQFRKLCMTPAAHRPFPAIEHDPPRDNAVAEKNLRILRQTISRKTTKESWQNAYREIVQRSGPGHARLVKFHKAQHPDWATEVDREPRNR